MPNLLDKLFRKKLQEREFRPEAGDWAAMNKLIETTMAKGGSSAGSKGAGLSLNWLAIILISTSTAFGVYFTIDYLNKEKNSPEIVKVELTKKTTTSESIKLNTEHNSNVPSSESVLSKNANVNSQQNSKDNIPDSKVKQEPSQISNEENNLKYIDANYYSENSAKLKKDNSQEFVVTRSESTIEIDRNEDSSSPNTKEVEVGQERPSDAFGEENNKAAYYPNNSALDDRSNANNNSKGSETNIKRSYYKTDFETPLRTLENSSIPGGLYLSSKSVSSFSTMELQTIKALSNDNSNAIKAQNIKSKRSLPLQLSIAAFGELSYVTKNIKGDREYTSLIRLRNDQEKNIFTVGGGLEFQVKYKRIGLTTGFASSILGENVQYEDQYTSEWDVSSTNQYDTTWTEEVVFTLDSVFIDSSWFYFQDSALVTVVDTIITTTIYDSTEVETALGLSDQNGRTTISYWEIPLYFSYQFDIGDFYLSPGLGVRFGFLKVTSGYYMNETIDGLININTGYSVMRKTLISGQINLGIGYKLGDKFSIEATPTYRFNLGNAFEKSGIIQKYSAFSIQIKLRYYF